MSIFEKLSSNMMNRQKEYQNGLKIEAAEKVHFFENF